MRIIMADDTNENFEDNISYLSDNDIEKIFVEGDNMIGHIYGRVLSECKLYSKPGEGIITNMHIRDRVLISDLNWNNGYARVVLADRKLVGYIELKYLYMKGVK